MFVTASCLHRQQQHLRTLVKAHSVSNGSGRFLAELLHMPFDQV